MAGSPASMFRGDAARTGSYPPVSAPVAWEYAAGGWVKSSPVVVGGVVYLTSLNGVVHAVDAVTGAGRWTYRAGGGIDCSPAVAGGIVYVASGDGRVHAIAAGDGRAVWTRDTGDAGSSSPAVAAGVVVVGGPVWTVLVFDAASGATRWEHRLDAPLVPHVPGSPPQTGPMESSPAIAGGAVVVTGGWRVHALDLDTGQRRWSADVRCSPMASAAVAGDTVYAVSVDGTLAALDAASGAERWRAALSPLSVQSGTPAVADGAVVVGGGITEVIGHGRFRIGAGSVVAVDAATGAVRWQHRMESPVATSPAIADGVVYAASRGNERSGARLTALDLASGRPRWTRWLAGEGIVSSPAVAGPGLWIGLPDGRLLALPAAGEEGPRGPFGWLARRSRERELGRVAGLTTVGPAASTAARPAPAASAAPPEPAPPAIDPARRRELEHQVRVHGVSAEALHARRELRDALEESDQAVATAEQLQAADPGELQHDLLLAGQLATRAAILDDLGELPRAVADARRALDAYLRAVPTDRIRIAPLAADVQARLGHLLARSGEAAGAREAAAAAVATYRWFAATDREHRAGLARALVQQTSTLRQLGDADGEMRAAREAVATYRSAGRRLELSEAPTFGRVALDLATMRMAADDPREAHDAAIDAVEQFRRCVTGGLGGMRDLVLALYRLGVARSHLRHADAAQPLEDALGLIDHLPAPAPPELRDLRVSIADALARLRGRPPNGGSS